MAVWRWAVGLSANGPERELSTAFGRRITSRVDAACDAQFSLNGDGDEIAAITPLASDLWAWRDGTLMFRGRIGGYQANLDAGGHSVQFSAIDYRGMLSRRIVGTGGAAYTATDQAAIAWDLIDTSQALSGGDWGITNGVGSTSSTTRDATWAPGKPIGDAIAELGRLDNGFEWEVAPDLTFNRWYPLRGTDNGLKLDYGGLVTSVQYSYDPGDFANAVITTGDQTTTPVAAATTGIGTDDRGRWELAMGYPTISVQATLNDRAPWLLSQTSQVRPDYRVKLKPGRWDGPSALWTGDTVYPAFKHGWLTEDGTNAHRAVEIQIVLGDSGEEDVQVGLLAAPA